MTSKEELMHDMKRGTNALQHTNMWELSVVCYIKNICLALLKNRELLVTSFGAFFISEAIGTDMSFFPILGRDLMISERYVELKAIRQRITFQS